MSAFSNQFQALDSLESCACRPGFWHDFHPGLKIVLTFVYIITTASCAGLSSFRLLSLMILLILVHLSARIPLALFWKRLILALPFSLFAGIWGCFWDTAVVLHIGTISITGGVLGLFSIVMRAMLSVGAVLILVGTTPMNRLSLGLRQIHCPQEIALIFELICRYLGIVIDEALQLKKAWQLRGGRGKGIAVRYFGSLAGGLMIRSFNRASRIFSAMQCRGYPGTHRIHAQRLQIHEVLFGIGFVALCLLCRLFPFFELLIIR